MSEHTFGKEDHMATIASTSKPITKHSEVHTPRVPPARFVGIVDRTATLSHELLKSFETNERAAIEAVGQFVINVEEAFPQEVSATTEVAKRLTESGLEMTDRLIHTTYHLLRDVVDSGAGSLSRHDGAEPVAV
jgi:hypothetical protein